MKRRSFLQAIGGAVAAGFVSNISAKTDPDDTRVFCGNGGFVMATGSGEPLFKEEFKPLKYRDSLSGLIAWFEHNFDCEVGPQSGLFYYKTLDPVMYETFSIGAADDTPEIRARMFAYTKSEFQKRIVLTKGVYKRKLFWRHKYKISIEPTPEGSSSIFIMRIRAAIP